MQFLPSTAASREELVEGKKVKMISVRRRGEETQETKGALKVIESQLRQCYDDTNRHDLSP